MNEVLHMMTLLESQVIDEVKFLNRYYPDRPATQEIQRARYNEAEFIQWLDEQTGFISWPDETCEHGLSAWLCAGPSHYPMDGQF